MKKQATKKQEEPSEFMKAIAERRKREKACPLLKLRNEAGMSGIMLMFALSKKRGRAGAVERAANGYHADRLTRQADRIDVLREACSALQRGISDATTKSETIAILYRLACGGDPEGVLPSASASCPGLCTEACTVGAPHADGTQGTGIHPAGCQDAKPLTPQTAGTPDASARSCVQAGHEVQPPACKCRSGVKPLSVFQSTPSSKPKPS